MKANVPKCVSLAVRASSGGAYDPQLTLSNQSIPFIGSSTFRFLGTPIAIHSSSIQAKEALLRKLQSLLEKVNNTLVSRQQKLLLFRVGLCPRLSWDLSVSDFSTNWLKSTLQPLATRYLKKWSGLARTADPNKLFLPKANGGLDLPELTTLYKKLHAAKAASFMYSRDPMVRAIASHATRQEERGKRTVFQPYKEVVEVMKRDPGASKQTITKAVKARVQAEDTTTRLNHSTGLVVQGQTVRNFKGKDADTWASVVLSLPEKIFKFALNSSTDTLPHNKNLCLWKKLKSPSCPLCGQVQTLLHILNHCPVALEKRRYNERHDSVLSGIHSFLINHLPQGMNILADLPGTVYTFPPSIALTDERPDIVLWNGSTVHLVELTVPFESGLEEASSRKQAKYEDLVACCRDNGFATTLTTVQVGSRGFLHRESLNNLYQLVRAPLKDKVALEKDLIKRGIEGSFRIWCQRNWLQ